MANLDEWDDNLIIDAYDKSMELVNKQVNDLIVNEKSVKATPKQTDKANKNQIKKWKVDDYCQAVYAEDGQLYEATIVSITGDNCVVSYIGYLNEETHKLSDLKESGGEDNRNSQLKRCQEEIDDSNKTVDKSDQIDKLSDAFDQITNQLNTSNNLSDETKQTNNQSNTIPSSLHSHLASHLQSNPNASPLLIPPPPANLPNLASSNENELLTTALISWYMSGYHTGYYQAIRDFQKNSTNKN